MSIFMELPSVQFLALAESLLQARPIPGGYSGMHKQELALALQRTADAYIERQYQIHANALLDP